MFELWSVSTMPDLCQTKNPCEDEWDRAADILQVRAKDLCYNDDGDVCILIKSVVSLCTLLALCVSGVPLLTNQGGAGARVAHRSRTSMCVWPTNNLLCLDVCIIISE